MTRDEILRQYPNEWLLIEYTQLDDELRVVGGHVIAHSPSKENIYQILLQKKGQDIAIEYSGRIPEDLAVMF